MPNAFLESQAGGALRRVFVVSVITGALLTTLSPERTASADSKEDVVVRAFGAFMVLPFTGDPEGGIRTSYYAGPRRIMQGGELNFVWPIVFGDSDEAGHDALDVGWGGLLDLNPSADVSARFDGFLRYRACHLCAISPYAGLGASWGRTVFNLEGGRTATSIGKTSPFGELGAVIGIPRTRTSLRLGFRGEYLTTDQHARTPLATLQIGVRHTPKDRLAIVRRAAGH